MAPEAVPTRRLTAGLVVAIVAIAFEALGATTVMPAAARELRGTALYGWATAAFMLASLVGIAVAGRDADRHGPGRPFAAGLAVFGAGLVVTGLAPHMPMLVAGRALQGLGNGGIGAMAYATIALAYPEERRPRLIAILSTAWVFPGLVGPGLSSVVAQAASWRLVFLGILPFLVLTAVFVVPAQRHLRPAGNGPQRAGTIRDSLLLTAGVAALISGLQSRSWLAGALLAPLGLAVAVPPLTRLLPPGSLRSRPGVPAAIATMALVSVAMFTAEVFLPLTLTAVRGTSLTIAGLALTTSSVTWATGSWVQERWAKAGSRRAMTLSGTAVLTFGVGAVATIMWEGVPVWVAPAAWAVTGLGMGLAYTTVSLTVLERAPAGEEGSLTAAIFLANTLGNGVGTGLGGAAVAAAESGPGPPTAGLATVYGIALAAGLLALFTASRMPGRRESTSSPGTEEAEGHSAGRRDSPEPTS